MQTSYTFLVFLFDSQVLFRSSDDKDPIRRKVGDNILSLCNCWESVLPGEHPGHHLAAIFSLLLMFSLNSHNSLVNAYLQFIGSVLRSIKTDFHLAIIFLHPDNFTVLGLEDIQAFAHVWVQSRQHPPAWKHPTILPSGF